MITVQHILDWVTTWGGDIARNDNLWDWMSDYDQRMEGWLQIEAARAVMIGAAQDLRIAPYWFRRDDNISAQLHPSQNNIARECEIAGGYPGATRRYADLVVSLSGDEWHTTQAIAIIEMKAKRYGTWWGGEEVKKDLYHACGGCTLGTAAPQCQNYTRMALFLYHAGDPQGQSLIGWVEDRLNEVHRAYPGVIQTPNILTVAPQGGTARWFCVWR